MLMTPVRRVTALTLLACSAGAAFAQPEEPRQLLLVEHRGLPALAQDPRDAGLRKAFEMLPARLAELRDAGTLPGLKRLVGVGSRRR